MKKALAILFGIALLSGVLTACTGGSIPVSALQRGVIRLHILANSDSSADQSLKLEVRDLVLKDWSGKLVEAGTAKEAWKVLNGLLPDIQKDISEFLGARDAGYDVKLETGEYDFPDKDYDGVVFPAGDYQALKIELGAGAGRNWWCVMFPPLCLVSGDGEMDTEKYLELVKELGDEGLAPGDAPEAPVRSWIFDQIFGGKNWDAVFLQWAKDYWLGGGGK